jgi:hypothetical protein
MTGDAGYRFAAALGRRRRFLRYGLPPLAVAGAAVALFCCEMGIETPDAVAVGVSALPMLLVAATWQLWRAPGRELPDLVRLRRRQRRICWRVAVVLLLASTIALVVLGYWTEQRYSYAGPTADATYSHYSHLVGVSQTVAAWSAAAAAIPVLLDPVIWRIWTFRFRGTVRDADIDMALQASDRYRNLSADQVPAPGFDPDRSWC